jgi:hypothetical protein
VVQVLRPFHDDSEKMQVAVDHLIDIGFMCRRDVLRAGAAHWGAVPVLWLWPWLWLCCASLLVAMHRLCLTTCCGFQPAGGVNLLWGLLLQVSSELCSACLSCPPGVVHVCVRARCLCLRVLAGCRRSMPLWLKTAAA